MVNEEFYCDDENENDAKKLVEFITVTANNRTKEAIYWTTTVAMT